MLRTAAPLVLVLSATALSACGPAGMVANSVVKESQGRTAADIERDIKTQFSANPALMDVKVSVAINNVWQNAFQSRYSVLLAGTVADDDARREAAATLRRVIGAEDDAVAIADQTRIVSPTLK